MLHEPCRSAHAHRPPRACEPLPGRATFPALFPHPCAHRSRGCRGAFHRLSTPSTPGFPTGTERGIQNTEHRTQNTEHRTQNTEHGTRDTGHGTRDTGHGTRGTGHGKWNRKRGAESGERNAEDWTAGMGGVPGAWGVECAGPVPPGVVWCRSAGFGRGAVRLRPGGGPGRRGRGRGRRRGWWGGGVVLVKPRRGRRDVPRRSDIGERGPEPCRAGGPAWPTIPARAANPR